MTANPPPDEPAPDHQEGNAADAIRNAEIALAHQNSATAQVDLQVVLAVLNAHERSTAGGEALDKLQHEIEAAVATRSDLDTPAGARDFQRYLIGKLRDIRAVVASATLDDTSNSALMAAWTSLYNAAEPGTDEAERRVSTGAAADSATGSAGQSRALLNGQIQHISTVNGPSFLGWEHPPVPVTAPAPESTDPPAPTRPAIAETTESA